MCPTQMIVHSVWTGFLIVGMSLAAPTSFLIAYIPYISVLSTSFTTRTESQHLLLFYFSSDARRLFLTAVAQTSPFHSAKRRRLYGLNSRFDRMLQEVSWTSNSTKASRPHYKRAHSPSSSSMTNHDLPKTPTDSGYGSGRSQRHLVCGIKTGNQVYFHSLWAPMSK